MAVILKNLFKCTILLLLVVIFLTISFYFLLNSGRFYQVILPRVVESRYPGIKFQSIKIESATYRFPDQFRFKNVEIGLTNQRESCTIKIIGLGLDRFSRFFLKKEHADISLSLSSFSSKDIEVNYSDLTFTLQPQKDQTVTIQGNVFVNQSTLAGYQLNDVEIAIKGNLNQIEVDLGQASFYGGDLAGQIWLENKPLTPYKGDLKFTLVSSARLDEIYRELNSNFHGLISGTIHVEGNQRDLDTVTLDLNTNSGAEIKAWVVGWLIDFVPGNKKLLSKDLKEVIAQNRFFTTDYLNVSVKNSNERTLQAKVEMKIKKYNLKPNYTFDINIDGNLLGSLKGVERFLKTGGLNVPR